MLEKAKKTRSISYRMDTRIIEEIAKEARLKETSANVLVNQILHRFVVFDRYKPALCLIAIPKQLLMDIMNTLDDNKMKLMAEKAYRFITDAAILMQKRNDLAASLSILREYAKISGITSDHVIKDGKDIIVIQHDMGSKVSDFVKNLLEIMFERLVGKRVEYELTESSVIITVELPDTVRSKLIA